MSSQRLSQTVPHSPPLQISTRPAVVFPPASLISPELHATVTTEYKYYIKYHNIIVYESIIYYFDSRLMRNSYISCSQHNSQTHWYNSTVHRKYACIQSYIIICYSVDDNNNIIMIVWKARLHTCVNLY